MEKKKDKESKKENTKSVPAAKPHFLEFLYKYLGLAIPSVQICSRLCKTLGDPLAVRKNCKTSLVRSTLFRHKQIQT